MNSPRPRNAAPTRLFRETPRSSLQDMGPVALYFYRAHPLKGGVAALCRPLGLHSLSSHRPTDTFWAPTPLHRVLSRKNISRKKDLYGKTKKSTHGHQNLIRSCTQPHEMPVARPRRRPTLTSSSPPACTAFFLFQGTFFLFQGTFFLFQGTFFHPTSRRCISPCRALTATVLAAL